MSAPHDIIERIKKLLRLARSSNPHEAQLALARAMELAREHQISVDALNPDATAPSITHCDTDTISRLSYDRRFASMIVGRFFRVKPIERGAIHLIDGWPTHGRKLTFVGTSSDVEVALYVYHFLVRNFSFCWQRHRGRMRNRYSFIFGMYQGIRQKLAAAEPPAEERQAKGTELVLSMDHYVARHIGPIKTSSMADPSAAAASLAGFLQGQRTEINPAVKGGDPAPLALR